MKKIILLAVLVMSFTQTVFASQDLVFIEKVLEEVAMANNMEGGSAEVQLTSQVILSKGKTSADQDDTSSLRYEVVISDEEGNPSSTIRYRVIVKNMAVYSIKRLN